MRRLAAPLLALFASAANAQFGVERIIEETETWMPHWLETADLDGDGDLDLLSGDQDRVGWFSNDGGGGFGTLQVIQPGSDLAARCVRAADLDGDGDLDVLVASWTDAVKWYANDGAGNFGPGQTISLLTDAPTTVQAIDMDGDADLDVVSASLSDEKIAWYANDGAGNFGPQQIMAMFYELWFAQAVDLDEDGDIDLLCSSANDDLVAWFENDGTNTFGAQQNIALGIDGANFAYAADLDGDGDNDVLSAAWIDNEVAWYENLGGGSFGPHTVITTVTNYARHIAVADIDEDGDNDVISASSIDDKIAWYANDGAANFGPQQIITTSAYWATAIATGDADGDGDLDVFSGSWEDDKIAWYANDGAGVLGPQEVLTTSARQPLVLHSNDLDGDGDPDVLVGAANSNDSRILSYENLGAGDLGPQQEITGQVKTPSALATADLDGDGDADLLSASSEDNKVAWYENLGGGAFGPQGSIDITVNPLLTMTTMDVDNDGDEDVFASGFYGLFMYLNDGSGGFGPRVVVAGLNGLRIQAADLDTDGNEDLLVATADGVNDKLVWLQNDGAGNFTLMPDITTALSEVKAGYAADLDGDGDMDALSASAGDDKIAWYANDGSGNFGPQQVITISADGALEVGAGDLNGDGDLDVFSISSTDNTVAWYLNDGSGNFGSAQVIANDVLGARAGVVVDLDMDGDLDVVASGATESKVVWYENHSESPFRIEGTVFLDVDLDGVLGGADEAFPWAPVAVIAPVVFTTFTEASGAYTAFVDTGAHSLAAALSSGFWTLTTSPPVQIATPTTLTPVITGVDFGFTPTVDTSLVQPTMTLGAGPCGGAEQMWITYVNQGTRVEQGVVGLHLDDLFTFVGSEPAPTTALGNDFTWDFDSLQLFGFGTIHIDLLLPPADSLGLPWSNELTVITVDGLGDTTGVFTSEQSAVVSCSFDPNDKQVEPWGFGAFGAVPMDQDWFTYTVRFQNTGTDTAYNVMVIDPLEDDLDRGSFEFLGASHPPTHMELEADGDLAFHFDGINLPDSGANFLGSQGFVKFRLRPLAGAPSGTEITNTASIHFDFNAPVITNTTINTLIDCSLFTASITEAAPFVLQASAGDSYQWYLDDGVLNGATEPQLLVTANGDYTVVITSMYGCAATSEAFTITDVGIEEIGALHCAVVPNPFGSSAQLLFGTALDGTVLVEMVDPIGRTVRTFRGNGTPAISIDRGDLRSGLYMIRVLHNGSRVGAARVVVE